MMNLEILDAKEVCLSDSDIPMLAQDDSKIPYAIVAFLPEHRLASFSRWLLIKNIVGLLQSKCPTLIPEHVLFS